MSNSGFAVITHFCGGEAVKSKWSIIDRDLTCGMTQVSNNENKASCENNDHELSASDCCSNSIHSLDCDDEIRPFNLLVKVLPIYPALSENHITFHFVQSMVLFQDHLINAPPLLNQNYTILFQSFLI